MKKIIRWQPELAQTIIYWSLTLIVLFFSLILSLENTRPYWKSNLVLGIFLVFVVLGFRRSFVLKANSIKIRYAAFWKDKEVSYQKIDSVTPIDLGVKMKLTDEEEPAVYIMKKRTRLSFCNHIAGNEQGKGLYTKK
ncbi:MULTISPECIES: EbsA family protein [unclassified Enterococcus]|uniref:EbsA family protein n=1 Tax=unclassified Enterococcus TaxID=2608891 RepID=UPI0013EDBF2A|nr:MULTISPECIES: EbsA family protein [unclassified Enterococcus]